MRIHILGICGTFMGGLAMLARQLGHEVTGSDANVYPPMSTLLEKQGIELIQGYDASQLDPQPDLVIIGNAMTRGNPCVEAVLEKNIPYMSGPQWLHDFVLRDRWVLAVAGTHGKTTTSTMLAHLMYQSEIGTNAFLGGISNNYGTNVLLQKDSSYVVVEADEYDRSFHHLTPYMSVITAVDPDHLDIYGTAEAYKESFEYYTSLIQGALIVKKGLNTVEGGRETLYV